MAGRLRERRVPFAVIGAAAMAVHGVPRSTRDLDLFTLAAQCLSDAFWTALTGVEAEIRRGDAADPLAGVARLRAPGEPPVDVVVGKSPWQPAIFSRVRETEIEGVRVPVASVSDLILLKLYAGGPQDAWDVEQLLAASDRDEVAREVDGAIAALPADSGRLWTVIRGRAG